MTRRDNPSSPRLGPAGLDDLPAIETGDEAADRIYRRLIARRRRWVHGDLVVDDAADRPDADVGADAGPDHVPGGQQAAGEESGERGARPRSDPPPGFGQRPAATEAGADGPPRGRPTTAPAHRAAVFVPAVASPDQTAGRPRADPNAGGPADSPADGAAEPGPAGRPSSERPRRRARPGPSDRSGPGEDEEFSLQRWQPRSHTVRFIKEHPGLAVAIGVPALLLLTRPGMAARSLRYVTSPAGMATIQRISTLATALGLLERSRR